MGMPKPTKKNIKFFNSTITPKLKNVRGIRKKRVASKRVKGGDTIYNEGIINKLCQFLKNSHAK